MGLWLKRFGAVAGFGLLATTLACDPPADALNDVPTFNELSPDHVGWGGPFWINLSFDNLDAFTGTGVVLGTRPLSCTVDYMGNGVGELECIVTAQDATGLVSLDANDRLISTGKTVTVVPRNQSTITSVTAAVAPGGNVTIKGTGFGANAIAKFNDVPAASYVSRSDTELVAAVANGVTGSVVVEVDSADGLITWAEQAVLVQ